MKRGQAMNTAADRGFMFNGLNHEFGVEIHRFHFVNQTSGYSYEAEWKSVKSNQLKSSIFIRKLKKFRT